MNPPSERAEDEEPVGRAPQDASLGESAATAAATDRGTEARGTAGSASPGPEEEEGNRSSLPSSATPASPSSRANSVSSPEASKKRTVRFDPSASGPPPPAAVKNAANAPGGAGPRRKKPKPWMHPDAIPRHMHPAKVGKANPVRDACLFLTFIGVGLYLTYDYGHPPVPSDNKSSLVETMELAAETVNHMTDALARLARQQYDKSQAVRPDLPCSVYASPSTLPGAGIGLFAGRDYEMGDSIPLSVGFSETDAKWIPIPVDGSVLGNNPAERSVVWAPAHALLMKHHPILANVHGTLFVTDSERRRAADATPFTLTASKPIAAGSELFASPEAHPHGHLLHLLRRQDDEGPPPSSRTRHGRQATAGLSTFAHIPTQNEYELADLMWDDADLAVRRMRTVHKLAQVHCGTWFGTLAGAVSRIDPTVGALLPASQPKHERGSQTTALASLKNQTVLQLRVKGSCLLEDVVYETMMTSSSSSRTRRAVAGRNVKKGSIVTRIPLHAVPAGPDQAVSCTASDDRPTDKGDHHRECYAHDDPSRLPRFGDDEGSSVVLYPLAHAGLLLPPGDRHLDAASNIELQWTDVPWSAHPDRSSIQDILTSPPGSLMWNVVATADLAGGDELVLPASGIASLLPDHWKRKDIA